MQRDAARNAATSRNSLDSDTINVEEPSARNMVTIDFDSPDINVMSDVDAEESNVQETKCDPPELNEEVDLTNPNTDNNAEVLNKIIDPIKENLEIAKNALNRDSSIVHDNIKGHLDKILKPIQKPSPKMQHLRLSELFNRGPLNQNKVSDRSQQIKSSLEENDEIVDMNNESQNTNCDLQDSDIAASTVTESIITSGPFNTKKLEKLSNKPSLYSKLGPLNLEESSKDTLNRLKDSNQRITNILKNALKNKINNKHSDVIENDNSEQQAEQQSMKQNDFQEDIKDMAPEASDNSNNIACQTEHDNNDGQRIEFQQMKVQVNDNIEPADSFIDETMNDDISVITTESHVDPSISTDPSRIESSAVTSNPSGEPLFDNIDGDAEHPIEDTLDVNQNSELNDNSQSTELEPLNTDDIPVENDDNDAEDPNNDSMDVKQNSDLNDNSQSTEDDELEPLNTEDMPVEDVDTSPDSIAEENHVTNHVVHFDGDELPNKDSITDGNLNNINPNQDSEMNNIHETSDTKIQEETSNVVDKDLQKFSDKLLHEGLKNGKIQINSDGCLVSTNEIKEHANTKESNNVEIPSTEFNKQNESAISANIKENPTNKEDTPSNVEQLDMMHEASELSSKYALPLSSKPLEGFKSRTPLFKTSIVQPEPLFPSFKNNANFNSLTRQLNLPSLDEMRSRLSDILNINEDGASALFPNFNSPQMKSASSFPTAKLDLSTLSDIRNNMFPNSKLQPSNGLNLNVFKLQPSPYNGLNFNSIRTKLPLKASGPLQPLKLLSTVKDRGGVLGASVAFNNAGKRNSPISRNTIETKKDIKPNFALETIMKRKVNSISTPTHVKINKENTLRSNDPTVGYSGRSPPNVPSETKRIITTFQKSSQGLQQPPLKSQKQQLNSKAAQRQTIQEPISNLNKPNTNSINLNTNLKDAVIQALTNTNNKNLSNNDRQNQISKSSKTNFNLNSKPVTASMKAATSNNDVKFLSNNRDKSTSLLKNISDKISYDSSPLASSPLIKNIQMAKESPLKTIIGNTASNKLKQIDSNIKSNKAGALESKPFSKTSENTNGQVLRKTLTNRKDTPIPTTFKLNKSGLKQVDHSWGLLKKDLLKNNLPDNKSPSRLWNGSKIPKIKIPLLRNTLLTNHKPFEKISTVEIINPFSKDLFGSADTQTPSIVSVSPSSKLLNAKGQKEKKNSLLRTVNDDCEEPVNINTDGLQEADSPKTLKKGLLLKPNDNTLLNKVRDAIKSSIDSQLPQNEKKKNVFSNDPLEAASSNTETLTDRPKTLSPLLEKLSRSAKKSSDNPILENIEDMPLAASEALPSTLCMLGQTATDDINYKCKLMCSKE